MTFPQALISAAVLVSSCALVFYLSHFIQAEGVKSILEEEEEDEGRDGEVMLNSDRLMDEMLKNKHDLNKRSRAEMWR